MRVDDLVAAGRRFVEPVGLALVLVFVAWWWLLLAVQGPGGDWAFDFRQFWQGANDVVHGVSPYPDPAAVAAAGLHLDPDQIQTVFRFPYPAGAAVALAPFGLLPFHAAAAVWSALLIASLLGALLVLGVRDWRVLAVVVSSAPVLTSVRLGTFTPVLVLLLAATWRWRDRPWVAGGSVAAAVSLKLFLWPVVVWLLATRRYAAAVLAAALAAGATLAAWAAIGFAGLADYPVLVRRLTEVVETQGYSLVALGHDLGLPLSAARVLPWLVGISLLVWAVAGARRGAEEHVPFSIVVVASIALTPIVWLHYFALLVVPLALARPRLSWPWALLPVFWLIPSQVSGGAWQVLLAIALVSVLLVQVTRIDGRRAMS